MKQILILLAFVGFSISTFSQVTVRPGLRGGLNVSKITNAGGDSQTGLYIGGLAAIKFARFYTLQPELTYSRQGGEVRYEYFEPQNGVYVYGYDNIEIQYLNFSIANKFSPIPNAGLHFIVGPSLNFKVSDNNEFYEDIEGFDIAIFGGIGYDFPNGLGIEARYNQGFVDIFGYNVDNNDDVYFDDLYLNGYFQVGATYKFDF